MPLLLKKIYILKCTTPKKLYQNENGGQKQQPKFYTRALGVPSALKAINDGFLQEFQESLAANLDALTRNLSSSKS